MINKYKRLQDVNPEHNEQHRILFNTSFAMLPDVTTTIPTTDNLQSGYGQIYEDTATGTRRLYMNINGNLIYLEAKNV